MRSVLPTNTLSLSPVVTIASCRGKILWPLVEGLIGLSLSIGITLLGLILLLTPLSPIAPFVTFILNAFVATRDGLKDISQRHDLHIFAQFRFVVTNLWLSFGFALPPILLGTFLLGPVVSTISAVASTRLFMSLASWDRTRSLYTEEEKAYIRGGKKKIKHKEFS